MECRNIVTKRSLFSTYTFRILFSIRYQLIYRREFRDGYLNNENSIFRSRSLILYPRVCRSSGLFLFSDSIPSSTASLMIYPVLCRMVSLSEDLCPYFWYRGRNDGRLRWFLCTQGYLSSRAFLLQTM